VKTAASNVGHCLWSGILRPDHAERVVRRFFEDGLWTGWGIRTLSARNPFDIAFLARGRAQSLGRDCAVGRA
jgi:hypothetical protein